MNSLCSISGHGFRGNTGIPILFTTTYTTSTITIAGYSCIPTEFKIRWTGGDALTVYTNNTSSMTFMVNGVEKFPTITYDGTNIFAVFTGLTNVAWNVVITSKVGTLASGSISIPQAPSSLSAGGTQYLNTPSPPATTSNTGRYLVFSSSYAINSGFTRLFVQYNAQGNYYAAGDIVLHNLVASYGYNSGIDLISSLIKDTGSNIDFDKVINANGTGLHTFTFLYLPESLSLQVDNGTIQTHGFKNVGNQYASVPMCKGTNYNMVGINIGSAFGIFGFYNFTNLLVTN